MRISIQSINYTPKLKRYLYRPHPRNASCSHAFKELNIQVCRPVFVPTLLYSADTWVLHQKQIRLPERFYQRCLRSILGIKWEKKTTKKQHVSSEEVLNRASLPSIQSILLPMQLRWAGNVARMKKIYMPKQSSSAKSKKEA